MKIWIMQVQYPSNTHKVAPGDFSLLSKLKSYLKSKGSEEVDDF